MFRFLICSLFCISSLGLFGQTYEVDNTHSSILFSLAHNTVGVAYGRFNKFEGKLVYEGDAAKSVSITLDVNSIDSADAKRDEHLRKSDFFNAVEFPKVTFESTDVKKSGTSLTVTGNFTMLGVSKPVTFVLAEQGPIKDREGNSVRGFQGTAKIKRSDWGMSYAIPGIGDEVTITVSLEAVAG